MRKSIFLAFSLSSAPIVAFAADKTPAPVGHLISFNAQVATLTGTAIPNIAEATKADPNCDKCDPLTLRDVAVTALSFNFPDEVNLPATEKVKRMAVAEEIEEANAPLALSSEDISMIKGVVGKLYSPLVIFESYKLLDPTDPTLKPQ